MLTSYILFVSSQRFTDDIVYATHQLPVYLEPEVLSYFTDKAKTNGVELNILINELLKKDIDLVEGVK